MTFAAIITVSLIVIIRQQKH